MVVLFITNDIYHLVNGIILIAQFGCADILSHVYRCPVATQKKLVVKTFACKVGPYRAVFFAIHLPGLKTFEDFPLAFEVSLAFVVNLVEVNAHSFVGFVKSGIDPRVHCLPEGSDFRVFLFPFHEHRAGFFHQRRCTLVFFLGHALLFKCFKLGFIMLVEKYIEITDKVVAFFP